jgi:2'-5' RNA ligase
MTVDVVVVMESHLSPKGPVYTRLEEVSLSGHEK